MTVKTEREKHHEELDKIQGVDEDSRLGRERNVSREIVPHRPADLHREIEAWPTEGKPAESDYYEENGDGRPQEGDADYDPNAVDDDDSDTRSRYERALDNARKWIEVDAFDGRVFIKTPGAVMLDREGVLALQNAMREAAVAVL